MAVADYYDRSALAASQVLSGFDEARFRSTLESTPVGVAFNAAAMTTEGEALADLLVRLLARLYPRLAILGPDRWASPLRELAREINPVIDICHQANIGVAIGAHKGPFETTLYAGSGGWDGLFSVAGPQPVGSSHNPFGPGTAACLAAANLFRRVFLSDWQEHIDSALRFSALSADRTLARTRSSRTPWRLDSEAALIGFGAVGNSAIWALARAPLQGTIHVVDPELVERSNIQRYVLTKRKDDGRSKVELTGDLVTRGVTLTPHPTSLEAFLAEYGYNWGYFLLGLDSARDRRGAQASLPRWVANAWTQPGDLGVSVHPRFGEAGACVACLYLPHGRQRNEDELVAEALHVPQLLMQVRLLLYSGAGLDRGFLEAVANAVDRPVEVLLRFEGRTVRDLYVEGFCGGAVIPLGSAGHPPQDVHVPLAHQSALAGVLLAAAVVRSALGADPPTTCASRVNVLRQVGVDLRQPVLAARDGRCICDDPVFCATYRAKYQ